MSNVNQHLPSGREVCAPCLLGPKPDTNEPKPWKVGSFMTRSCTCLHLSHHHFLGLARTKHADIPAPIKSLQRTGATSQQRKVRRVATPKHKGMGWECQALTRPWGQSLHDRPNCIWSITSSPSPCHHWQAVAYRTAAPSGPMEGECEGAETRRTKS